MVTFDISNYTMELKEAITIFGKTLAELASITRPTPRPDEEPMPETTVFTDGACDNNSKENASASSGVWYDDDNPRNQSIWVPLQEQSNQTGEVFAILLAVRSHPPNKDVTIVSDSKYTIDSLTRNTRRWEDRGWIDIQHGELFQSIVAWMRWRNSVTRFRWVKGHSGTKGNKEADKLVGQGAKKPLPDTGGRGGVT